MSRQTSDEVISKNNVEVILYASSHSPRDLLHHKQSENDDELYGSQLEDKNSSKLIEIQFYCRFLCQ